MEEIVDQQVEMPMDAEVPEPKVAGDMEGGRRRRRSPMKKRTSRRRRRSPMKKRKSRRNKRKTKTIKRRKTQRRRRVKFNLIGGGAPGALPDTLGGDLMEIAGLSADPTTRVVGAPAAAVDAANQSNQQAASTRAGTVRSA